MNYKKILMIICVACAGLSSCEKYEDYLVDYKYSAVYFASQKPLRTIVAYDEMNFKVGVALAGKRANKQNEYAEFEIDPSLLNDEAIVGQNNFELLPSEYYSLSDENEMIIPEGEFIGDITVTLDKNAFTSDSLSTTNTYALPLRVTSTSVDSILSDKDYTVLVVKYISPYHGTYYHKGQQTQVDSTGNIIEEITYSEDDLSQNSTWLLTTIDRNTVETSGIGDRNNGSLILDVNEGDNTVDISSGRPNNIEASGSGSYNEEDRTFYLDYEYEVQNQSFEVKDTLILRRPPEEVLTFEEW